MKDRSLPSRCVRTTPPFCRSVGAQSTAQPWHSEPILFLCIAPFFVLLMWLLADYTQISFILEMFMTSVDFNFHSPSLIHSPTLISCAPKYALFNARRVGLTDLIGFLSKQN